MVAKHPTGKAELDTDPVELKTVNLAAEAPAYSEAEAPVLAAAAPVQTTATSNEGMLKPTVAKPVTAEQVEKQGEEDGELLGQPGDLLMKDRAKKADGQGRRIPFDDWSDDCFGHVVESARRTGGRRVGGMPANVLKSRRAVSRFPVGLQDPSPHMDA